MRQRDRLFRRAWRHTILVRVLRVLLPVGVVASFGFYGVLLRAHFATGSGTLQFGKIEVTTEDLKMKNPSYFGVTQDHGKYTVHAREAAVDIAMTGPVKLEGIDGDLVQASGVKTNLKATRGVLDNKKGELELYDGVDIHSSNGMVAHLLRAMVLTREHYVSSRQPLTADMPAGRLTANWMDFWTDKKKGFFSDNITLRLVQPPAGTGAAPGIGLGDGKRQPVDISAHDLTVDDALSIADFHTGVIAKQGETQLTAPFLRVTYQGRAVGDGLAAPAVRTDSATSGATSGEPGGGTQLTHLEAYPNVVLTAGSDRRLIADRVDFDIKADTALFAGNVELRQAKNVFRGGRLSVDRKAGKSRLDSPGGTARAAPGRIAATLVQASDPTKPATSGKSKVTPATGAVGDGTSPFGGFRSDPNAPTDVEADTLEVDDLTKQATFRGHVIAKQGEFVIRTAELIAHFTGQTGIMSTPSTDGAPAAGKGSAPSGVQMTTLETKGGTRIVAKDGKEAEGATAHFDLKANQVTMDGPDGITLHQGQNITQGRRLRMDLTSGQAHIENAPGTVASGALSPGQLSIAAKPGVAPPAQPTNCHTPNGQQCMIFNPGLASAQAGAKPDARKTKPAPPPPAARKPPVEPQSSPSAVYRSN